METYYLIDYENIKHAGVKLSYSGIPKNSNVIFFLTPKDKLADSDKPKRADIDCQIFDNIPEGMESVDKYIVSYMGYLAGVYGKETVKIYIISKNRGYDNIITFMSDLVSSERREQIAEKAAKTAKSASAPKTRKGDDGKTSKCLLEAEEALYEYGGGAPRRDFNVVLDIVKTALSTGNKKKALSEMKDNLYRKFPYIGEFYMEVVTPAVEDFYK